MNKKLGRLLRPGAGVFFVFLMGFALAAGLMQQYLLAGIEIGITAVLLTVYLIAQDRRRKQLKKFLAEELDETNGIAEGKTPFPMLVIRLEDNGVVYANDAFVHLTGFQDTMRERCLPDVIPNFSAGWLLEGKQECPYDLDLCGRRFRVYGTVIQVQTPQESRLGVLYLTDLTELYQVRDEYIRSRPVVSIILVDNYEELTKNLTESGISTLNAKLNEAKNIRFFCADAGKFMVGMAEANEKVDVVFMDPPRAGSDEAFLSSVVKLSPKRIVYISCNPETLARDLMFLTQKP